MRYTPSATALQEIEREYGDILSAEPLDLSDPEIATILPSKEDEFRVAPPRETSAMRAKINAARPLQDLKRAIIQEWLTGCYDEHDALYWLMALKLVRSPQRGDAYRMMSYAAQAAFGDVELPEPSMAPIPTVSRSEPFLPALSREYPH